MIEIIKEFFQKFKIDSDDLGNYPIEELEDTDEKNGVVFNIKLEKQVLSIKYAKLKKEYESKINNHLDIVDDLDSLNIEKIESLKV